MNARVQITPRATPEASASSEPYVVVTELLGRYYEALFHGDVEALYRVFHPGATYATASGGELVQLDLPRYLERVATRESPDQRGDAYGFTIESIEFAGPTTALVRMRSAMLGKRFVDFLALLKTGDKWRIAAKVFHYDSAPG